MLPTLRVKDNFEDIDFIELPNNLYFKCIYDSSGLDICNIKLNLTLKSKKIKLQIIKN